MSVSVKGAPDLLGAVASDKKTKKYREEKIKIDLDAAEDIANTPGAMMLDLAEWGEV